MVSKREASSITFLKERYRLGTMVQIDRVWINTNSKALVQIDRVRIDIDSKVLLNRLVLMPRRPTKGIELYLD